MQFIHELKRRKVFRVAGGYAVFAWLVIQVVETVFPAFGLDDAAFRMLVILLATGLVPVVILSWAFDLRKGRLVPDAGAAEKAPSPDATPSVADVLWRPRFAVPLLAAFVLAAGAIALLAMQLSASRSARLELLPRIESHIAANDIAAAYSLALEAEQALPDDPLLHRLLSVIAVRMSFVTEPSGADVYYRRYGDAQGDWVFLGTTPLGNVRLPREVFHWRFEKPGFQAAERANEAFNGRYRVQLTEGQLAENTVEVPSIERQFLLTGYPLSTFRVPAFRADRFEATNEEFADFVRQGYENAAYWSGLEFILDGRRIAWEEAVDRFRDRTGRFGPSTWEGGTYPEGAAQHPVAGISWYEAAAYARFRGKQLPTIYHWSSMTVFPAFAEIEGPNDEFPGYGEFRSRLTALSNFSEAGPAAVGAYPGVAPFGTYDAAGNVREWCWNATGESEQRYILGGSFKDPTYLYTYGVAKSAWDRSAVNGVRLASYEPEESAVALLRAARALPERERLEPVSDEVFEVYRNLFDYDPKPLDVREEAAAVETNHWTHESVSFTAAYDDERVIANVFLPKNIEPPYQVIVYYPGSAAIFRKSSDELELNFVEHIIKSGRAVVFPVLWATYERNIGLDSTWPQPTREYSNNVVRWIQDFRRTVDYLETRPDMDLGRLGFYGFSWGGWNGPIVLSLDKRFATGVFLSGGIPPTLARPEASSASYASRVTQPVLMISGEADVIRPVATYQRPMFDSLGTEGHLKRHAILSGGHVPAKSEIIAESLAWFDEHLGAVE